MDKSTVLENGWRTEVVRRKNGMSAGRADVYFYSPCGKKFRSMAGVRNFLGDSYRAADFDSARPSTPPRRSRPPSRQGSHKPALDPKSALARGLHALPRCTSPPRRSFCAFVRQPVTCLLPMSHDFELGKAKPNGKGTMSALSPSSPLQVFGERRLYGNPPVDQSGKPVDLALGREPPSPAIPPPAIRGHPYTSGHPTIGSSCTVAQPTARYPSRHSVAGRTQLGKVAKQQFNGVHAGYCINGAAPTARSHGTTHHGWTVASGRHKLAVVQHSAAPVSAQRQQNTTSVGAQFDSKSSLHFVGKDKNFNTPCPQMAQQLC